jgi:hypothetical protein
MSVSAPACWPQHSSLRCNSSDDRHVRAIANDVLPDKIVKSYRLETLIHTMLRNGLKRQSIFARALNSSGCSFERLATTGRALIE